LRHLEDLAERGCQILGVARRHARRRLRH
jgi:hypothetical protein